MSSYSLASSNNNNNDNDYTPVVQATGTVARGRNLPVHLESLVICRRDVESITSVSASQICLNLRGHFLAGADRLPKTKVEIINVDTGHSRYLIAF